MERFEVRALRNLRAGGISGVPFTQARAVASGQRCWNIVQFVVNRKEYNDSPSGTLGLDLLLIATDQLIVNKVTARDWTAGPRLPARRTGLPVDFCRAQAQA